MKKRKLGLQPRKENIRDKKLISIVNFNLDEINNHFEENLDSLKQHFKLADDLIKNGKEEAAKDIWRIQIVFLESALDYYIHEITKYGMNKIFNNEWERTEKYDNYNFKLSDILYVLKNPEDVSWFVGHVNDSISCDVFMDYYSIKGQLNLLGIDIQSVADHAFYIKGSTDKTLDQLKTHLNRIFKRRNDIVHQSDRNHSNAQKNDITEKEVKEEICFIDKIVKSINKCILDKNCRQLNNNSEGEFDEI